jgi:hypothetical protein
MTSRCWSSVARGDRTSDPAPCAGLAGRRCSLQDRLQSFGGGDLDVKGKGPTPTYFLLGRVGADIAERA